MKKNFFHAVALSALLALGATGAQAQRSYECPPLNPELKVMADEVIKLNMDDPDKASKSFMKIIKKIQGKRDDLVAVGTYFLENNNYPAANMCADQAYKAAPTSIPVLMFSGEVFMKAQRWGQAGQRFDEVLSLDEEYVPALKRNAFVYKNVNPYVAIEALNKIKRLDPSYIEADKILGDIYYKANQYKDAISSYELYYKAAPKDANLDIRSCENFLQSLYSQANFDRITEVTTELLPLAPKDMVIRRMDFFAKVNKIGEAMDYEAAIADAEKASAYLSDTEYADSNYISIDYEYAAALAKEKQDYPAAIAAYEKALEKDTSKVVNYRELAKTFSSNKQSDKAIATYKTYIEKRGEKVDANDYYGYGREYLKACQYEPDSLKKEEYIAAGDAAFAKVLEMKPAEFKAVIQQAILHMRNSQKPEDEPRALYEKALSMMPSKNDGKSSEEDVLAANPFRHQAAQYLAFYFAQKDDYDTCRKYVNMMLEADPDSSTGKSFDATLKSMNK